MDAKRDRLTFWRLPLRLGTAGLLALLSSGCVTVETWKNMISYQPVRLGSRVEARVSLDVAHTASPEMLEVMSRPDTMRNWEQAVRSVEIDDIVGSGLFASAEVGGVGEFDYLVRVRSQDLRGPDRFSVELQVCDWATRNVVGSYKRETEEPHYRFGNLRRVIQTTLAQIKADVLRDAERGKFPLGGSGISAPVVPPVTPIAPLPADPVPGAY